MAKLALTLYRNFMQDHIFQILRGRQ